MTKVAEEGEFKLYVYVDHNPPHAHIQLSDGREVLINLVDGSFMTAVPAGKKRKIGQFFKKHLEIAWEEWDRLNESQ